MSVILRTGSSDKKRGYFMLKSNPPIFGRLAMNRSLPATTDPVCIVCT